MNSSTRQAGLTHPILFFFLSSLLTIFLTQFSAFKLLLIQQNNTIYNSSYYRRFIKRIKKTKINKEMAGPDQAAQHSTEVLHQRKSLGQCPLKMALTGFAFAGIIGYFVLYSKKKPEASALDVAKVTAGVGRPETPTPAIRLFTFLTPQRIMH